MIKIKTTNVSYNPIYVSLFLSYLGLSIDKITKSLSYMFEDQTIDPRLLSEDLIDKFNQFNALIDANPYLVTYNSEFLAVLPSKNIVLLHAALALTELEIEYE